MALKTTSGAWTAAWEENRMQRNAAREAFFTAAGFKPATSLRDIQLSPATRITRLLNLAQIAASPRIEGAGLAEIAQQAALQMALVGLAVPNVALHVELRPLGLSAFAPENLKSFFETDQETALERSLF